MVISPMQRERERETNYRAKKVHKTNIDLDSIFAKKSWWFCAKPLRML